jgi:hypothetical protein
MFEVSVCSQKNEVEATPPLIPHFLCHIQANEVNKGVA